MLTDSSPRQRRPRPTRSRRPAARTVICSTWRPRREISPLDSAASMNSAGDSSTPSSSCTRSSASAPTARSVCDVDDRLEVDLDPVVVERVAQLMLHVLAPGRVSAASSGVEHLGAVAAVLLGPAHGQLGVVHQGLGSVTVHGRPRCPTLRLSSIVRPSSRMGWATARRALGRPGSAASASSARSARITAKASPPSRATGGDRPASSLQPVGHGAQQLVAAPRARRRCSAA